MHQRDYEIQLVKTMLYSGVLHIGALLIVMVSGSFPEEGMKKFALIGGLLLSMTFVTPLIEYLLRNQLLLRDRLNRITFNQITTLASVPVGIFGIYMSVSFISDTPFQLKKAGISIFFTCLVCLKWKPILRGIKDLFVRFDREWNASHTNRNDNDKRIESAINLLEKNGYHVNRN